MLMNLLVEMAMPIEDIQDKVVGLATVNITKWRFCREMDCMSWKNPLVMDILMTFGRLVLNWDQAMENRFRVPKVHTQTPIRILTEIFKSLV